MKWEPFPDGTFQATLGAGKATVQSVSRFSQPVTWLVYVRWKDQSRIQTDMPSQQAAQEWAEAMLRHFQDQDQEA